jgi:hypothetical protein
VDVGIIENQIVQGDRRGKEAGNGEVQQDTVNVDGRFSTGVGSVKQLEIKKFNLGPEWPNVNASNFNANLESLLESLDDLAFHPLFKSIAADIHHDSRCYRYQEEEEEE